ncbi:DUF7003 family protein [Chitinophaga sancti]|uniref:Uncharacterized protein n=1 Tax=Chitinophaga sancti TaxID=1004 RepID=A0A1K1NH91_9BACT|nr:hypothetical protein [Chitinophaga sancti]WQD63225.1 hypothetical protein U0033_02375 [Chitinophaga sancti]WQG91149.1 hypothetical protein SR876_06540 [Chitinophaga sancti]SFW34707.1 hypothetical protein SAMN05661012_01308 [Chitinophaga sancti]
MYENKAAFSARSIRSQLDKCAEDYTFPMLDNGYTYPVVSRLSVYGDPQSWVILIEVVGYFNRQSGHEGVGNTRYVFGNHLSFEPGMKYPDLFSLTADSEEGPTFTGDLHGTLNPDVHSMLVREKKVNIRHDPAFYESRNVVLEDPPAIMIYEFLRASLPELKDELLSTEEELRNSFNQDLPLLLRLDEWCHPDLVEEEIPSKNETFRMIAALLETGDVSLYQPTKEPNNHWSNWPGGGSL